MVPWVRFVCFVRCGATSSTHAPRGTGGWLNLPRWGLPPHKKRQASLGALTLGFRRARKPERGTSGGWRQSGASPCWALVVAETFALTPCGLPARPHTRPRPAAARGRDTASGPSASHPPPATRLVPIAATHAGHPLRRPAHVATPSSRAERLRQARRASGSTPACGTGTPHGRRAAAALRPRRARSVGGAESGGPCSACPWRGSTPASPRRTCTCERSTVPCGVVLPVWVRCPLRSGRGSSPGQGPLAFCLPRLWRPTLRLSRARKPKRRRSVGCRASAVGRRLRAVVRPRATPKTLDQPAPLTRLLLALVWLCCLL